MPEMETKVEPFKKQEPTEAEVSGNDKVYRDVPSLLWRQQMAQVSTGWRGLCGLARVGTSWRKVAWVGAGWHRMARDGTGWHRMARVSTESDGSVRVGLLT